ncbi:hypothetical protein C1645_745408 [Glomus cerebriforme]|uniref:Uncharacterized protein n=1 Tax=Glomus cerebriforme TaxID=658196 RepID=A0A397SBW4_9GLOM|nr:hypothetical protein C1645_745408 [Glomus cerebriforme]
MNKSFKILTILFVLFAKVIITGSFLIEKRTDTVTIHVPAPGPGPWKRGSVQNVSWWCNECKSSDKVIVEIIGVYDEFELGDTVLSEVDQSSRVIYIAKCLF